MIKISTEFNKENNAVNIDYEHKESCTLEHIALLRRLFDEIKKFQETTDDEIYEFIKLIELEDNNAHSER